MRDDPRSGRPSTVCTQDVIDKVHDIILSDRRTTERSIAFELQISQERVHHIIHEELGMSKVSTRWVPRLLTPDHKRARLVTPRDSLVLFEQDPDNFLRQFLTVDKTWVHHYQPESKEQLKQWKCPGSPTPQKAQAHPLDPLLYNDTAVNIMSMARRAIKAKCHQGRGGTGICSSRAILSRAFTPARMPFS